MDGRRYLKALLRVDIMSQQEMINTEALMTKEFRNPNDEQTHFGHSARAIISLLVLRRWSLVIPRLRSSA